jgi:hypothetical protein
MMTTVTVIVVMLRTNVSNKYLAIRGIVDEVGGKILETNRRKTTMERRTVTGERGNGANLHKRIWPKIGSGPEMVSVIFSPESVGKKKTAIERNAIKTVGMISTIV